MTHTGLRVRAEQLAALRIARDARISPDGTAVAYIENSSKTQDWHSVAKIVAVQGGKPRTIPSTAVLETAWSPTSQHLAILTGGPTMQLQIWEEPWLAPTATIIVPQGQARLLGWTSTGDVVGVSTSRQAQESVRETTAYPYRLDGHGWLPRNMKSTVWRARLPKKDWRPIASYPQRPVFSEVAQGDTLTAAVRDGTGSWTFHELHCLTRETRKLDTTWTGPLEWIGRQLQTLWFVARESEAPDAISSLYIATSGNGVPVAFDLDARVATWGMGACFPTELADGSILLALTFQGVIGIWRIYPGRDDREAVFVDERQNVRGFTSTPDGIIAVNTGSLDTGPDLHLINLPNRQVRRLTRSNPWFDRQVRSVQIRKFQVPISANYSIEAIHYAPRQDIDTHRLYIDIHGGPDVLARSEVSPLHPYRLMLVERGWHVVQLNGSGRDGYGLQHLERLKNRWGDLDVEEHKAVIDWLIEQDLVDPNSVAVGGYSYGGYLAGLLAIEWPWLLAAVCAGGAYDLASWYRTSDVGKGFIEHHMGGSPYERLEHYRKASPLHRLRHRTCPVLVVHGEADLRDPSSQAHEWFRALKDHGTDATFISYADASHLFYQRGSLATRIHYNSVIVDWLEDRVRL